ncbi:MAG: alanine--tRNA ligase [Lachnospiraceae bacterium]|nr:alanine--tRNA ligase [Lachnospiraceae bacterium]
MKKYGVNELRKMFLEFFEGKDHLKMNSFSLVPHNDNSLLIINSGMAPLKPYFTGQEIPPRKRVTTCQKCIRTGDLENVGKTARHGTFFEMLGNFSFGDYFKNESIPWAWEFLTKTVGLDENRLYPSVYVDDDEAYEIWNKKMGIAPERIFKFGKEDNFWEHGSGPCGPCSEIYYDRGEKYGCGKSDCTVGCDCDRYMEVWNIVFSQFDNDGKGNYSDLVQKNIDTGMGLERLAVAVQDVDSIFDVDTLESLRSEVCKKARVAYKDSEKTDVSIRIITDHIRSTTFMISDGILPSNEGRGYVLRRLIRRACRHGRLLGIQGTFLTELAKVVIRDSKDGYPELEEKKDFILKVISQEEEKFDRTIDSGLSVLKDMEKELEEKGEKTLSGENAFRLYDTYGFPLDITKEILEEKGISVDEEGYAAAMKEQSDKARNARKKSNYMGADATIYEELPADLNTQFTGYDKTEDTGKITALCVLGGEDGDEVADALTDGMQGAIITDKTPFYGTMGGQVGDKGVISCGGARFEVSATEHVAGSKIAHIGRVTSGMFKTGDEVTLTVDKEERLATCRNHSATHLLQRALRDVLGTHVEQSGSYQDSEKTRFDFSHFEAMTPEEIERVEKEVNEKIAEKIPVVTQVLTLEEAKKTGAMALFGEKYGETVRVVGMDDYSKEFCGGTHVKNTGDIVTFKIVSEAGIAAGVRRIEAITGSNVFKYYAKIEERLAEAAKAAKTTPDALVDRIGKLQEEIKALKSENESLKSKAANEAVADVMDQVKEIKGVKLLATSVKGVDMNGLRDLSDNLKLKLGEGVVVLLSENDGKVNMVVSATDGAMAKGAHAGNLIKEIASLVGGGGGGRPNMAQAGGKNPAGIEDALKKAEEVLEGQLN